MSGANFLEIRGLDIKFPDPKPGNESRIVHALRGIDLSVADGEIHALVEESGSGKSVTAKAVMGLNPVPPAVIAGGSVLFDGRDVLGLEERELRAIRGGSVSSLPVSPSRRL